MPTRDSDGEMFEIGCWMVLFLEVRLLKNRCVDDLGWICSADGWCRNQEEQQETILHLELME